MMRNRGARRTVGTKSSLINGISVKGQHPMEIDRILEVEEVVAVDDFQIGSERPAADGTDKGPGVVVLQFVVIGKGCAVSIQQAVRTLVAIHLKAAIC